MKISSNHIIIVLVAFLVGVGTATLVIPSPKENEIKQETPENEQVLTESETETEHEGETMENETVIAKPPVPTALPSSPAITGKCSISLSGQKDDKLNGILLSWNTCASEDFQFYKLVKSSKNSNPSYPADPVAYSTSNKNVSNFIDKTVAARTTYYYRACVIQRLNQVNCSNTVSVSY